MYTKSGLQPGTDLKFLLADNRKQLFFRNHKVSEAEHRHTHRQLKSVGRFHLYFTIHIHVLGPLYSKMHEIQSIPSSVAATA